MTGFVFVVYKKWKKVKLLFSSEYEILIIKNNFCAVLNVHFVFDDITLKKTMETVNWYNFKKKTIETVNYCIKKFNYGIMKW